MKKEKRDFFISYNRADKQWAKWIAAVLENTKKNKTEYYSCYIQAWDFRKGDNFVLDMQDALLQSDRFIAVLSPDYLNSMYCQAEWAAAFTKDPNSMDRSFIPVRVSDIKPEGLLAAVSYINLFAVDEQQAEKELIRGVDINEIPRNRPSFPGTVKERFPGTMPFHNLPFIKNNYFTGRDTILEKMHKEFQTGNVISKTQSIAGLGGIGKTQIALEYAYRYSDEYDWIWWVSAETDTTVLSAYREFAKKMKLINKEQEDAEYIIESVLNWMDSNSKWLLIFDNIDYVSADTPWWPKNNRGNILITTRNTKIPVGKVVPIVVFEPKEAVSFLSKRTGLIDTSNDAAVLAKRLGFLPLAIEQAAAYIRNNDCTYNEYISLLNLYGLRVLEEVEDIFYYKKSVTVTWKISLDRINQEASRQLLYLCSYLASENIKQELFGKNIKWLPSPLCEKISNSIEAHRVYGELTQYALLERQETGGYSIHRLLQEVVRSSLQNDPQWYLYVLKLLCETYKFEYELQNEFIINTSHMEAFINAVESMVSDGKIQEKLSFLYAEAGYGNSCLGDYPKAMEWYQRALDICEKVLGKKHPYTATSYNNIASVYSHQGDYPKALEWFQKTLDIRETVLGKKHPDTATSYNNIAGVYSRQGDYPKALEWFQKALDIREKVLGKEHPSKATSYNNVAGVYSRQGDYPKALKWYQRALNISEKVLGKGHPDTAKIFNNIAGVYDSQGDYSKALEWLQKALDIREKVLGKEHPDTANSYNNIAVAYDSQGDYPKALEWYQRALDICEKVLGKEHPNTLIIKSNIEKLSI